MEIKVSKYAQTPSGRRLRNKYIVYNKDTMKPLSSIGGTSRTSAYKLAKMYKTVQKLEKMTIEDLQKKVKSKSKDSTYAIMAIAMKRAVKRQKRLSKGSR